MIHPLYLVIVVLVVLALFSLPTWGYSSGWGLGYYPSGILGLILIVVVVLLLLGRL